jgi:hypothetical protein
VSCALFRSDLRRVAAIVAGAPWFSAWSELDVTGFNAIAYLEAQYPQRPIEQEGMALPLVARNNKKRYLPKYIDTEAS